MTLPGVKPNFVNRSLSGADEPKVMQSSSIEYNDSVFCLAPQSPPLPALEGPVMLKPCHLFRVVPGLSRPPRLFLLCALKVRGRRDKPGDDAGM